MPSASFLKFLNAGLFTYYIFYGIKSEHVNFELRHFLSKDAMCESM